MVEALQYWRSQPWSPLAGVSMRPFLLVMGCVSLLAAVPNFTKGETSFNDCMQEIAVPSYRYPCLTSDPGCAWPVWKQGATIVVINPNSGPGSEANSDYTMLVATLKQNSTVTTVLGYVATHYTQKSSSLILSEIDDYYQYYPQKMDGIFFDEGNISCDSLTQYKSYDDHVKSKGGLGFTALNWGTIDDDAECFLEQTNINTYVTFEHSYMDYSQSTDNSISPPWVYKYNSSQFWHIVYETPNDEATVQEAVDTSQTRHAGFIYFTDATLVDNPYNKSPSTTVWDAEVSEAGEACSNDSIQEIAVPSYKYPCSTSDPGCAWAVWKQGATIVVINPNSGPGSEANSDYTMLVANLKQNSTVTTVLGYVATHYTQKSSSLILSEIDDYYQYYPQKMDGIFFDEGNISCNAVAQYKSYDAHVKSKGGLGFTALNWGTIDVNAECFLKQTNINTYVTFQGSYMKYSQSTDNSISPPWVYNYNSSQFWHIVYETPNDEDTVQDAVDTSQTRNAGFIYFTDATLVNNPYNKSASTTVWAAEVSEAGGSVLS